nr:hypothetical protein [uncultured Roseovarius sp.]
MTAHSDLREQDVAGCVSGRRFLGVPSAKDFLRHVEAMRRDDLGNRYVDCGLDPDLFSVKVVPLDRAARKQSVHHTGGPVFSGSGSVSILVQPRGDRFAPHRAGLAVSVFQQVEHFPDDLCLDRIQLEFFLGRFAPM